MKTGYNPMGKKDSIGGAENTGTGRLVTGIYRIYSRCDEVRGSRQTGITIRSFSIEGIDCPSKVKTDI